MPDLSSVNISSIIKIAVPVIIVIAVIIIIGRIRRSLRRTFGGIFSDIRDLSAAYRATKDGIADYDRPRSVSGGDSIYLPQILKDFPDFSVSSAKAAVRDRITEEMADKSGLKIHTTAISGYVRSAVEKEIIFQCAFEYAGAEHKEQKRYALHYVFTEDGDAPYVGMVCPNCGGPIPSTSAKVCEYCSCRLVNVTDASWKFTQVYEK